MINENEATCSVYFVQQICCCLICCYGNEQYTGEAAGTFASPVMIFNIFALLPQLLGHAKHFKRMAPFVASTKREAIFYTANEHHKEQQLGPALLTFCLFS